MDDGDEAGTTPRWDEVGERFTQLGRTLQQRWSEGRSDAAAANEAAAEEVRGAVDGVKASLDDLADTITRTVHDDDVHDAARSAAGGLVEALSASLDDLAGRIQRDQRDRPGRS
jgi:DNA-binding ferritin-like protein